MFIELCRGSRRKGGVVCIEKKLFTVRRWGPSGRRSVWGVRRGSAGRRGRNRSKKVMHIPSYISWLVLKYLNWFCTKPIASLGLLMLKKKWFCKSPNDTGMFRSGFTIAYLHLHFDKHIEFGSSPRKEKNIFNINLPKPSSDVHLEVC